MTVNDPGRDLTADDVRDALHAWGIDVRARDTFGGVADNLNRIARPADDWHAAATQRTLAGDELAAAVCEWIQPDSEVSDVQRVERAVEAWTIVRGALANDAEVAIKAGGGSVIRDADLS